MQGIQILNLLMARLGNRTEPELRALCLLEMQLAQETIMEGGPVLPWFIVTEEATVLTTPQERRVEVPEDFIREVDQEKPLMYRPASEADKVLDKKSFEEAMTWYGSNSEGPPEVYAMRGDYFMIFPKPDAAYTLVLPGYYARQTAPADSTAENKWQKWASDLCIATAGKQIAEKHIKDDTGLGMMFEKDIALAYDRLNRMEVAREEANRDRRMG
jgi:hypothetical protein